MQANKLLAAHRKAERDANAAATISVAIDLPDADFGEFESEPEYEDNSAPLFESDEATPHDNDETDPSEQEPTEEQLHKRRRLREKTSSGQAPGYPQRPLLKKKQITASNKSSLRQQQCAKIS